MKPAIIRWLIVSASALLITSLTADPAAASCYWDVSDYADGAYGSYNGEGHAELTFWASGIDSSWCDGGGLGECQHLYQLEIDVTKLPEETPVAEEDFPSATEGSGSEWVAPAQYKIESTFWVWCSCAQSTTGADAFDVIVEVPEPAQGCAIPTNFHQVGAGVDIGDGRLKFEYTWDSSSTVRAHLSDCEVGERVSYQPEDFPWPPPFPETPEYITNPWFASGPGSGQGVDIHRTDGTFRTPYFAKSMTAAQRY